MAQPQRRRATAASQPARSSQAPREPKKVDDGHTAFFNFVASAFNVLKWPATAIVSLSILVAAWNALHWPVPATVGYVDYTVDAKVGTISHRIDLVDSTTLQNRIETLTAAKRSVEAEISDLNLKKQNLTAKDNPGYATMVNSRLTQLTDEIGTLNTQINNIQLTLNSRVSGAESGSSAMKSAVH